MTAIATAPRLTISAARRRYIGVSILTWAQVALHVTSMVLLMRDRGISIAEVGALTAIYSATTVLLELPTGGLADVIGRRRVLLAAAVVATVSMVGFGFAATFWWLALVHVGKATARALGSGPAEAWFVDIVHEHTRPAETADTGALDQRTKTGDDRDSESDIRSGLGAGASAAGIALAVAMVVGGLLTVAVPSGPINPLALPVIASVVIGLVRIGYVWWAIVEEHPGRIPIRSVLADVPRTVRVGANLVRRDSILLAVMLATGAVGLVLNSIELLTPDQLARLSGNPATGALVYSLVAAVGFGASGLGSACSNRLGTAVGNAPAAAAGTMAAALVVIALAGATELSGWPGIIAIGAGYIALFFGLGIAAPLRATLMHQRVGSKTRATVVSLDSLGMQLCAGISGFAIAALAQHSGLLLAWGTAGAVLLASTGLFWWIRRLAVLSESQP